MATNSFTIDADVIQTAMGDVILPGIEDTIGQLYPMVYNFYGKFLGNKAGNELAYASKSPLDSKNAKMTANSKMIAQDTFRQGIKVLPLPGLTNSNATTIKTMDNSPVENYTQARYAINYKHQPIGLTEQQYRLAMAKPDQESAEKHVINLMSQKMEDAYDALAKSVEQDIVGTNTNETSGVLSLTAAYAATGTYGSLNRTTFTTWAGNTGTYTAGNLDDPSNAEYLPRLLHGIARTSIQNESRIEDLCFYVNDEDIHDALALIFVGNGYDGTTTDNPGNWRLDIGAGANYAGWEGYSLNRIPVIPVPLMPSGKIILVNHRTTFLVGIGGSVFDGGYDKSDGSWMRSETTTSVWNRLYCYSQLVSVNPRQGAVYTAA